MVQSYPTEMLWNDLWRAAHARNVKNMAELKQFYREWFTITPGICAGLIHRCTYLRGGLKLFLCSRNPTAYMSLLLVVGH